MELYLVTDPELMQGKDFYWSIEQAVLGGVDVVQLREKNCSTREFITKAIELKKILTKYNVPLIINDRIDVAIASGADGIHIGQCDMPYEMVRKIVGNKMIIGLSVESKEQVYEANKLDVDYIAASPVFATDTKTNTLITWGLEGIEWIKSVSNHKLVAIGGVNHDTIKDIIISGADSAAVISAILATDNPQQSSKELKNIINLLK